MASPELRRKAFFFVIFVAVTVLLISTVPVVELWLQSDVFPEFGLVFAKGWTLTEASAEVPMNVSYANALDTCFRIIKILLWMALVIAAVRFIAYLILQAA